MRSASRPLISNAANPCTNRPGRYRDDLRIATSQPSFGPAPADGADEQGVGGVAGGLEGRVLQVQGVETEHHLEVSRMLHRKTDVSPPDRLEHPRPVHGLSRRDLLDDGGGQALVALGRECRQQSRFVAEVVRRGAVGDACPAGHVAKQQRADAMDLDRLLHGLEEHRRQIPRSVAHVQHLATGPSRKSRPAGPSRIRPMPSP